MIIDIKISKNKSLEIELGYNTIWSYFQFNIKCTTLKHSDHAGLDIYIEILGLFLIFNIYDIRHSI